MYYANKTEFVPSRQLRLGLNPFNSVEKAKKLLNIIPGYLHNQANVITN